MGNGSITRMATATPALPDLTPAAAMKIRFKEKCTSIGTRHRNWQVRVHRALSWLKRADQFTDEQPEAHFLFLWIALNSLYSGWDPGTNAPGFDTQARDEFLRRVCEWDKPLLAQMLKDSRGLVKKLLENPYLAASFWKQPDHPQAKAWATVAASDLDRHLKNGEISIVLIQAMHRLFIFRGQLVHGASSGGSRLNRGSMKYCLWALQKFVPLLIHVVIEHGCHDDWPDLCYPPLSG